MQNNNNLTCGFSSNPPEPKQIYMAMHILEIKSEHVCAYKFANILNFTCIKMLQISNHKIMIIIVMYVHTYVRGRYYIQIMDCIFRQITNRHLINESICGVLMLSDYGHLLHVLQIMYN